MEYRRGDSLVNYIAVLLEVELRASGIHAAKIEAICHNVQQLLRVALGGAKYYFGGQEPKEADHVAAQCYEEWQAGKSAKQIARERGFTPQWAHELIRRERARREGVDII